MSAELSLAELLRASPGLAEPCRGIARAAESGSPILILGEPGTGRSTLARALHGASSRRSGPLVEVDLAVLPVSLAESELFGYRAGAFSGADHDRPGRVEQAEGGTLIFDHVEELPLPVQPKLLRLLAERRYVPLGGAERAADVRFMAIAHDDLSHRVEHGAFREDLFYRLEVLAFRLPPLRHRREDLPSICTLLLQDLAERFEQPVPRLQKAARRWMAEHPWPGNLRQLRNVLERSVILRQGGGEIAPEAPRDSEAPLPLAAVERKAIARALAYTRGHQGRAAALLGISRKTLWEKRRRYGIP